MEEQGSPPINRIMLVCSTCVTIGGTVRLKVDGGLIYISAWHGTIIKIGGNLLLDILVDWMSSRLLAKICWCNRVFGKTPTSLSLANQALDSQAPPWTAHNLVSFLLQPTANTSLKVVSAPTSGLS